jgi:hypothetical protein
LVSVAVGGVPTGNALVAVDVADALVVVLVAVQMAVATAVDVGPTKDVAIDVAVAPIRTEATALAVDMAVAV